MNGQTLALIVGLGLVVGLWITDGLWWRKRLSEIDAALTAAQAAASIRPEKLAAIPPPKRENKPNIYGHSFFAEYIPERDYWNVQPIGEVCAEKMHPFSAYSDTEAIRLMAALEPGPSHDFAVYATECRARFTSASLYGTLGAVE